MEKLSLILGYIYIYWGYIGIMEKKTETTTYIGFHRGSIGFKLGLYWDNGKENGNYYTGLYRV